MSFTIIIAFHGGSGCLLHSYFGRPAALASDQRGSQPAPDMVMEPSRHTHAPASCSLPSCMITLPPEGCGPHTTCYNRFVRWRQAGVWDRFIDALAAGHDAAVQMIDTSVVQVHQHGVCIADNNHQDMGRSRGGLTSRIHTGVDSRPAADVVIRSRF